LKIIEVVEEAAAVALVGEEVDEAEALVEAALVGEEELEHCPWVAEALECILVVLEEFPSVVAPVEVCL
jgi:hypothetical protein